MTRKSIQKSSTEKENNRSRLRAKSSQTRPSARVALQSLNGNAPGNVEPSAPAPQADVEAMQQRIQELEAQLAQTPASQARTTPSIPDESIDRPRNASKIQMRVIRRELGYDKERWNSFRSYCRDAVTSARLNWDGNWKSQRSEKLAMAYNAIEAAFPETRRFEGQWAIDRTVKQCWDNRKNYRNCVNNPTTFRGKEAAARRARRGESPGTTPHTSPSPPRSPTAPRSSGSPTPGPSRPHARPINRRRIDDSDDDSNGDEDEFVDASDPECTLDKGDGNDGKSAKGKGKRKATTQGGKSPKQARRDNQ